MPAPGSPGPADDARSGQACDRAAAADLAPLVYDELRRLARSYMGRGGLDQTLQPTALVHEAYLKLIGHQDPGWEGRRHFFGAAARAMRQIMVDAARRKASLKHGGDRLRTSEVELLSSARLLPSEVLALDQALDRLEQRDSQKHRVVMIRFFAGLTEEETAAVLGISTRTVQRAWRFARAWLHREMEGAPSSGADADPA